MLAPDTILRDRYRIVRLIGQGGMGAVYQAIDQTFDNKVALKQTFFNDPQLCKAFEREARLLNHLRHAALPVVFDYFHDNSGQFLVMQFIPGDDLGVVMEKRKDRIEPAGVPKPFEHAEILEWSDQLLAALDYLHTQQPPIIHRDIKPHNLKLTQRGEIVLLDFGLAKGSAALMSRATSSGSIFGYTPSFAPLEQIQGTGTDPRSDLYSLAATMYHLLTGTVPVDALTRATAAISGQPDPLPSISSINPLVPDPINAVLMQAMAQNPNLRPASANDMRRAMREAARLAANEGRSGSAEADVKTILSEARNAASNDQQRLPKAEPETYATKREGDEAEPSTIPRAPKIKSPREPVNRETARPKENKTAAPADKKLTLTPRQREILEWLVNGSSDEQIAQQLSIQKKTVTDHVSRLMQETGVITRKDLIIWAMTRGINPATTHPVQPVATSTPAAPSPRLTSPDKPAMTPALSPQPASQGRAAMAAVSASPPAKSTKGRGWLILIILIGIGYVIYHNWNSSSGKQPATRGLEPPVEAFTESSATPPPAVLGSEREAWVQPNALNQNGQFYHVVHCRFSIDEPKVYGVTIIARFYTKGGVPLKAQSSSYSTPTGQTAIQSVCNIIYKSKTYWGDLRMYMPKSLIPPGDYYAEIEIASSDGRTLKTLKTDSFNVT